MPSDYGREETLAGKHSTGRVGGEERDREGLVRSIAMEMEVYYKQLFSHDNAQRETLSCREHGGSQLSYKAPLPWKWQAAIFPRTMLR